MRFITLVLACCFASLAQAHDNEANREEVIRLLLRMDELVPVKQEFTSLGFAGENLDLAMAQHRRIFSDRQIAGFMADRLISAYDGEIPSAALAGGLLGPLIDRGIGHLPTSELAYFYKVENTVFGALPFRECGLAVKQRLSERRLSDVTARAAARLNPPALREYYRLQYKAARLGLNREVVRLSTQETARIEARIAEKLFADSEDDEANTLLEVFSNPERASNRAACEAGRKIMGTVMTLKGRDLRQALIYFSSP